jgi:uncharacterized protein (TIGR02145 family)
MNRVKLALLAASMVLAMAFTFSCSSGDDDDNGPGGGGGGKGNNMANYKTKVIGTQTWMAENMNHAVGTSKCCDDKPANCDKYGRLYDWETAKTVCPSGWRLPSAEDWDILMNFVQTDNGGTYENGTTASIAGKYLKATSGWKENGNGEDKYGFAALPGGYDHSLVYFSGVNYYGGRWWSSSEYGYSSNHAYYRDMHYLYEYAPWEFFGKSYLFSVRCVKD